MLPERVEADAFTGYRQVTGYDFPTGADVFDLLNDGRIIALVDANVYIESALQSRTFNSPGPLPAPPPLSFPSFVRVSPDGIRIAVGDGIDQVGVFTIVGLAGVWFTAPHYDAEWYDDRHLALSGGMAGSVTLLDTQSSDPQNPTNPLIIINKGVPGGITFDPAGNLYTANGFSDSGPVQTGDIKYFAFSAWRNAVDTSTPLDFIANGTLIVNLLSGASLGFDHEGNLHVAGGDFFGGTEVDFVGLVRAAAIADAISGGGPADAADPAQVRTFDPDVPNDFDFYAVGHNPVTRELYLQNFGENRAYVLLDVSAIPTVSQWGAVAMTLLLAGAGTLAVRRARTRLA